jgi:hypothetical protein
MPLTTLVTNEVKDSSGAEVEFVRINTQGRTFEYAMKTEAPNLPHRIIGAHRETGSGTKLRRSSKLEVVKTTTGVDGTPAQGKARIVIELPQGNLSSNQLAKDLLAELGSLAFTLATNTFLYDGTGNGASILLSGGTE